MNQKNLLTATLITAALGTLSARAETTAMHCTGTEPFWSAHVTDNQIMWRDPVTDQAVRLKIDEVTPAVGFVEDYIRVYKAAGAPQMVIQKISCSDNMSDTEYEYQTLLFKDGNTYQGCCSLTDE
ncbi:MAG TPA: hypothetical protein VM901_07215 [Bdellovibrionota bacterium]|jgi:uncharacterized membrane protein|nr:hypothetical protein [Bdellovibrionota bacterium]